MKAEIAMATVTELILLTAKAGSFHIDADKETVRNVDWSHYGHYSQCWRFFYFILTITT